MDGPVNLRDLYSQIITENSRSTAHRHAVEGATHTLEGVNPSCGDAITLSLRVQDGRIAECAFTGSGCAVSQASTDIMADLITDETVEEALRLSDLFLKMIRGEADDAELEDLGEAAELKGIALMPARVKCAELGWRTLATVLTEEG